MAKAKPKDTGKILIHGKEYLTVALRVKMFHEAQKDERKYAIQTKIIARDSVQTCIRASIVDIATGVAVAVGHAEEFRRAGMINKTSALENAETSAIGRALASFGFGGSEFASANEVEEAIKQQKQVISPAKEAAIRAYLEQGLVKPHHLEQSFGHATVERLLDVEADRVINGVQAAQATGAS